MLGDFLINTKKKRKGKKKKDKQKKHKGRWSMPMGRQGDT